MKIGESQSSGRKRAQSPPVHPFQTPLPFYKRMVLSKTEPRLVRFQDTLRKIYVSVLLLEALKEVTTYLKFLREILSKKGKLKEVMMIP